MNAAHKVEFTNAKNILFHNATINTGYPSLDELLGGIRGGYSYLFYGNSQFKDELIHRLMIRACKEGKVAYLNNTSYHSEKTLLEPDKLAFYSKIEGLEPDLIFDRVYFAAYNELGRPKVFNSLRLKIQEEKETKLIIIHNLSRFFLDSKDATASTENLNHSLISLWRLATERRIPLIITSSSLGEFNRIPRPSISDWMRRVVNVIAFFRDVSRSIIQIILIKHPTYRDESIEITLCSKLVDPYFTMDMESIKDLLTPLEKEHESALTMLDNGVWRRKITSINTTPFFYVTDLLNLTISLYIKSRIERLENRIDAIEKILGKI